MRKVIDEMKNTIAFAGDRPDGGIDVECGFCGKEYALHGFMQDAEAEPQVCPHCGKDILYWSACEW